MCIEFAPGVGQATFGGGDAPSNMDDLSLGIYCSCLCCDRPQVVDLKFERGIACTDWEHGLYGATKRGVQERRHDSSMHLSQRIVMILRWFSSKDNTPFAHLSYPHAHQDSDGRRRKLTRLYGSEVGNAADRLPCLNCFCRVFPGNRAGTARLKIGQGVFLSFLTIHTDRMVCFVGNNLRPFGLN